MKSDIQIKSDVGGELMWDPEVEPANVGVAVKDGIVTLRGEVDSLADRDATVGTAIAARGVLRGVDQLAVSPGTRP